MALLIMRLRYYGARKIGSNVVENSQVSGFWQWSYSLTMSI